MKRQMGERDIRRIEAGLKNLEVREGLTVKANILLEKITKKLKVDNDIAEEVFSKMIGRVEEELDGTGEKLSTDQLLDSLAWVIDNIDISHFRTEVEEEKRFFQNVEDEVLLDQLKIEIIQLINAFLLPKNATADDLDDIIDYYRDEAKNENPNISEVEKHRIMLRIVRRNIQGKK